MAARSYQELSARNGLLVFRFVEELHSLRIGSGRRRNGMAVGEWLPGGWLTEVSAIFAAASSNHTSLAVRGGDSDDPAGGIHGRRDPGVVGVDLFGSSGGVRIAYNASRAELSISGHSTRSGDGGNAVIVPLRLDNAEGLQLHVYIDGSVVEAVTGVGFEPTRSYP